MSDRYCIRGCKIRGEHFGACARSGETYEGDDP